MYPALLFFALHSPFSLPIFQTLLDAGHPPAALILPNPNRTAPLTSLRPSALPSSSFSLFSPAPSLTTLASHHQIPILTLGNLRHTDSLNNLHAYQPDLILTACFPRLLPPEILAIPRLGALNLHPSLLPAYRGPEPLFWQFFFGETHTGITLHFMDEQADTGDIVFQANVPFPDGITLAQAETLTAQVGGELILRALSDPEHLPRTPQPHQGASAHPRPNSDNLVIPISWTARRAFNFLQVAQGWGPFNVVDEDSKQRLRVREVLAWDNELRANNIGKTGEREVWVQFADGAVKVRCD